MYARGAFSTPILLVLLSSLIISALLSLCILKVSPVDTNAGECRVYLHFKQNDAQFEGGYLGNSQAADSLAALIQSLGPDRIESVNVTAYASPEGTHERNMQLTHMRAAQFGNILESRLPQLSDKLEVQAGGEAWQLLRERVANDSAMSGDSRRKILATLDDNTIGDDTRKWRLAHRLDQSDYRYLLEAHYRYLRCLEIVIRFKEMDTGRQTMPDNESRASETVQTPVPYPEQGLEPEPDIELEPEFVAGTHSGTGSVQEQPESETVQSGKGKPVLAISTNIPYDITYVPRYGLTSIPSLSLEYYPSSYGHWSFGADAEFPMWKHWDEHRFLQIQNLTLNTRFYLKKGDYRGLYALANVNAARYGIGWDAKGWEGEGFGVSAGLGYKFSLCGRLFLDTGVALGYFHSRYDPYEYGFDSTQRYYYDYVGLPEDFVIRNHTLDWFGPTRVWIALGYDFFTRKAR